MVESTFRSPCDVVGWLGAVQAQDYAGAKWALGLRAAGLTDSDVEQAFTEGAILRTHLLRPTWHFVTPADIRWMLSLTAPRVHAANSTMYRKLGLDAAVFKRSTAAMVKALQGGQHLTRDELRAGLEKAGVPTTGALRMAYLMMAAELDGVICSGPRRGKQFTYALLDERVPQARSLRRDAALAELTRRYFASRGPATARDFAKWSGLTVADAKAGLEGVEAKLEREVVDGHTFWFSPVSSPPGEASVRAHLLSVYDEYVSGYKDRSAIVEAGIGARLSALGNALAYIVVVDGQVVGTWSREVRKNAVCITTTIFSRLARVQERAIRSAAQRYGEFLRLPVVLT
jgi:hypothetical protein